MEAATEFSVSKRTIARDLDYLSTLGVPLQSNQGNGGGFILLENGILPPIAFSEKEITSILFSYTILSSLTHTPFSIEIDSVKEKLMHYFPNKKKEDILKFDNYLKFISLDKKTNPLYLERLLECSLKKFNLSISYEEVEHVEKYLLRPIGVYFFNDFWYVVGYIFESSKYRIFRVDRIIYLEETDYRNIDKIKTLNEWYIQNLEKSEYITIEIVVTAKGYRTITNYWILNGKIIENKKGYNIIFSCMKSQIIFIIPTLLQLGSQVKVLSPNFIINELKKEIKKMNTLYD